MVYGSGFRLWGLFRIGSLGFEVEYGARGWTSVVEMEERTRMTGNWWRVWA